MSYNSATPTWSVVGIVYDPKCEVLSNGYSKVRVRIPQYHGLPGNITNVPYFVPDTRLPYATIFKPIVSAPFTLLHGDIVYIQFSGGDMSQLIVVGKSGNRYSEQIYTDPHNNPGISPVRRADNNKLIFTDYVDPGEDVISPLAYQYLPMSYTHHTIRNREVSAVVIHYTASIVYEAADVIGFWNRNLYSSSNYIVDVAGRITCVVPEQQRAYTSSSYGLGTNDIDDRAITIECSCNYVPPDINRSDLYTESEESVTAVVNLLADIAGRYNLTWLFVDDPQLKKGNIHAHFWYAATPCPGSVLYSRFREIEQRANAARG